MCVVELSKIKAVKNMKQKRCALARDFGAYAAYQAEPGLRYTRSDFPGFR